jgi:hypothetical protein
MARLRVTDLTDAQRATFAPHVAEWVAIGLATGPCDRIAASAAMRAVYKAGGVSWHGRLVWAQSPVSLALCDAVLRDPKVAEALAPRGKRAGPASVWDSVGDSVWDSVRDSVGDSVGDSVRDSVRASVRDSVGDSVRDSVGDSVGDSVRASVRASVWDSVRDSVNSYWETPYLSFYAWFAAHADLADIVTPLDGLIALQKSAGWWIARRGVALVAERPTHLLRDDQGRLHATDRPAVVWPDGWGVYAWHGTRVPADVIKQPQSITADRVVKEANAEVRRVMLERLGHNRFIADLGALPVHADRFGTLYRVELPDDEPLVMVSLVNSTPEPDGADRAALVQGPDGSWAKRYWLRVPPDITTAHAAVAWTFNKRPAEYQPAAET